MPLEDALEQTEMSDQNKLKFFYIKENTASNHY